MQDRVKEEEQDEATPSSSSSSSSVQSSYVLTRLVKGLGSSDASARQGFFVALVEMLRRRRRRRRTTEEGDTTAEEEVRRLIKQHLQHKGAKSVSTTSACGSNIGWDDIVGYMMSQPVLASLGARSRWRQWW